VTVRATRRSWLRRAVESGDPRLGFLLGVAISFSVALAFACRHWTIFGLADRAELAVLDYVGFRWRPPIAESDKILQVDIDDGTIRDIPWPMKRRYWAQVITALGRLSAEHIVFDVEFKTVARDPGEYDPETGEYRLDADENLLSVAIARSGRVALAYHFELGDPIPGLPAEDLARMVAAFEGRIGSDAAEVAGKSGVAEERFGEQLELVRHHAALTIVSAHLAKKPDATFSDLLPAMTPPKTRPAASDVRKVQHVYWLVQGAVLLQTQGLRVRVEGLPPQVRQTHAVVPPLYPFLEGTAATGYANAQADSDGVLRRPWLVMAWQGRPYFYLGLVAGARALAGPGEETEIVVRPRELALEVKARAGGEAGRRVIFPLDEEGRVLVNWAGNAGRRRGRGGDLSLYFAHLPFIQLAEFFEERYKNLDDNVRSVIGGVPERSRQPHHAEYLEKSDALATSLVGTKILTSEEFRALESRLDEIRHRVRSDLETDIRAIDEQLPKLADKKRLQERLQQQRDKLAAWAASIQGVYAHEEELRKLIAGKVCLIGSASTASGDLHSSPLGPNTPGVDMHANVVNMALTGQMLRTVPGWVNFMFILAAGLAVTAAVTYWNAAASTSVFLGVVGFGVGTFILLFRGPGLLITGAGPAATAILNFAGVMTFREVVTRRSKRKLQRELEKNTSPELVEILMEQPELVAKPRKMIGTFLFSDVKGFTSISEKMEADVLVPYINRYLDRMTRALMPRQAFLDKYIGDGIMALFGIPVPSPDHAKNACLAALESQAMLKTLNAEHALQGLPSIQSRIGIHSGEATAGYLGGKDRANYTVIGDNVNLASRLEGANKEYGTAIMLSEPTRELVGSQFVVRELDNIRVVGKRNAVRIYELIGPASDNHALPEGFLEAYEAALRAFKERRFKEAVEGFERALALRPGDPPSKIYVERAKAFLVTPPPADWESVFDLHSK
jgi:class 3 adenylate cyclase/CHASE2 domain-containing sensor protein